MLVREAIRTTRRHLGLERDTLNRLDGSVADSDTTLTLDFATPVPAVGSIVELRSATAAELAYVWAVSGQDVTVERGYEDTTAAAFADEDHVAIDPVLSYSKVLKTMTQDLQALPSEGLGQTKTATVTFDYALDAIDTSAVTDLVTPYVLQMRYGGRDHWNWKFIDYPGIIRPYEWATPDGDVTLHYRGSFSAISDLADDLSTDVGVPDTAEDIVPISTALRLAYAQEQLRSQVEVQTHARESEDVPPGSGARSVALLAQWKATRLAHEQRRIRESYPRRRL